MLFRIIPGKDSISFEQTHARTCLQSYFLVSQFIGRPRGFSLDGDSSIEFLEKNLKAYPTVTE